MRAVRLQRDYIPTLTVRSLFFLLGENNADNQMNSSGDGKKRMPMLEDQISPSNLESPWKSWNINRDNPNVIHHQS
jgi:hypothetical protein